MEAPAKRPGRFDWSKCDNNEVAGLIASGAIAAENGGLSLAFQVACVNKELSMAVKTKVNKELTNLQSLYEDYRKLVLTEDKIRKDDPQWESIKKARDQLFKDFKSKFEQLIQVELMGGRSYLCDLECLQKTQTTLSALPDSNKFVMSKFGFTFEDYTLAAHMCRSVCMLSSSMSTLDNWVAMRAPVRLHFPFAQQQRLGCIAPIFYCKHTMYPGMPHGRIPRSLRASLNCTAEEVKEMCASMHISLEAVTMQFKDGLGASSRVQLALKTLKNNRIGSYKAGEVLESTEVPFFPSAFVPRENSVAGRLHLTEKQIKRAKEQVARHEEARVEEKKAIQSVRLRRFNADASAWLKARGHELTVEEVLRVLDDNGQHDDDGSKSIEDHRFQWEQTALSFLESRQLGHPVGNAAVMKQLKRMSYQLTMRDKLNEFYGELIRGTCMSDLTKEPSLALHELDDHIPSQPVDDMAVAVWFVVDKIMCGQAKIELKGASHKDLRWSVDLGSGFKLEQLLQGVDDEGRTHYDRFDGQHIRKIFLECKSQYGVDVRTPSFSMIERARDMLCGIKIKGKNQKDWGAELIDSIRSLDREVLELMGKSHVIFQIFRIFRFPDIENALTELHRKWRTTQAAGLPDKCPLTTRDFVLELIGNPLKLRINYVHRIAPEEAERHAEYTKKIFSEILEIESSDEDVEMEAEAGPSACYVPTSPQYSPTSPQYDPGDGVSYSPTSLDYADADEAPEYQPV